MIARRLVSRPVSTIGTLIAPRVTQEEGPRIVTEGLVVSIDPSNPYSYIGSGTSITDLSGSGNNGTLNNSPTFLADRGGLLSLDGTDDSINFGREALTSVESVSTTFWVWFPANYGPSGWQTIVVKRVPFTTTTANNRATFTVNYISSLSGGNNQFQLQYYSPAGTNRNLVVTLSSVFPTETWHHVGCVFAKSGTNTVLTLYKNGVQNATATRAGNLLSYTDIDLRIGSKDPAYPANFGLEYGNFRLGRIEIYGRALSASEVFQNFQATRWRFGI